MCLRRGKLERTARRDLVGREPRHDGHGYLDGVKAILARRLACFRPDREGVKRTGFGGFLQRAQLVDDRAQGRLSSLAV